MSVEPYLVQNLKRNPFDSTNWAPVDYGDLKKGDMFVLYGPEKEDEAGESLYMCVADAVPDTDGKHRLKVVKIAERDGENHYLLINRVSDLCDALEISRDALLEKEGPHTPVAEA